MTIDNRRMLRSLMELYDLSVADTAMLMGAKPTTVTQWRAPNGPQVPEHRVQLLKFKLEVERGKLLAI